MKEYTSKKTSIKIADKGVVQFLSPGVLYNKESEGLLNILNNVFRNELPHERLKAKDYKLELKPLKVDRRDLLSRGESSKKCVEFFRF